MLHVLRYTFIIYFALLLKVILVTLIVLFAINFFSLNMKSANQLAWRGGLLFLIGTTFSFVLNVLHAHQHSSLPHPENWNRICLHWWLPVVCGSASVLIGFLLPILKFKGCDTVKSQDWSHVLRCTIIFVGLNEACTKIEFPSNLQLSISLAILSLGLWWYFDGTPIGFGMGIITASIATMIAYILVYNQLCIFSEREFSYLRAWLPCVVFSGGITIGNIGEKLAANDNLDGENKSHAE